MQPLARDRVAWFVDRSLTVVSSTINLAEPIEMPFGFGLRWAQGIIS